MHLKGGQSVQLSPLQISFIHQAASVAAPATEVAGPASAAMAAPAAIRSATPAAAAAVKPPAPAAPAPPNEAPSGGVNSPGVPAASTRVYVILLPASARVCKTLLRAVWRPVREPGAPPAGLALPWVMLGLVASPLAAPAPRRAAHVLAAVARLLGATGVPAPSCSKCNHMRFCS